MSTKRLSLDEKVAATLRGEYKVTREDVREETAIHAERDAALKEWLESHEPGRKLDALVAEKVMGYTLKREDCNSFWVDGDGDEPSHAHDYSTNMEAAWALVEHMTKYEIRSVLNLVSPQDDSNHWFCFFSKKHAVDFDFGTWVSGESGPHAICLAALDACGVKSPAP